jgi:hypothetical protein
MFFYVLVGWIQLSASISPRIPLQEDALDSYIKKLDRRIAVRHLAMRLSFEGNMQSDALAIQKSHLGRGSEGGRVSTNGGHGNQTNEDSGGVGDASPLIGQASGHVGQRTLKGQHSLKGQRSLKSKRGTTLDSGEFCE